jgi:integrase
MARTIGRLTATKVLKAKPSLNGKTVLLCDGGGLWLQVSLGKDGQINRSWIFRYAAAGTKISSSGREYRRERQMGLGALHTVGLAEAREAARGARFLVQQGKDPLDEKNACATAIRAAQAVRQTFADAARDYLRKFEGEWKNRSHVLQWHKTLAQYVYPVLGKLDVRAINTDDVLRTLEPIWTRIPETASRIRGRIETVLDFAGRSEANPARWKGHLEHKLTKRNKTRSVKHLAAMPYDEVAAFMTDLRGKSSIGARALELTVLCATRTNETLGATWSEFNLRDRVWTIPAARTKRDREHRVPLSDAAVAVLEAMAAIRRGERVFPVNVQAMRLVLADDLKRKVTVHGFRATFRSWAGACTTHPRDVCEAALGHTIGNAVEVAYMRDALLAKRRVLMSDWADFCGNPQASVVRLDVGTRRTRKESESNSTDSSGDNIRNVVPA